MPSHVAHLNPLGLGKDALGTVITYIFVGLRFVFFVWRKREMLTTLSESGVADFREATDTVLSGDSGLTGTVVKTVTCK